LLAALLSERDPFLRSPNRRPVAHSTDSDVLDRLQVIEQFEQARHRHSELGSLDMGAAQFVLRARDQLFHLLKDEAGPRRTSRLDSDEALGRVESSTSCVAPPRRTPTDSDEAMLR